MPVLPALYRQPLALLTDLYQLTMAYGYFKLGRHNLEAAFQLTFRKNPFAGGYAIAAGLAYVVDYLEALKFDASDLAYLETLTGNDGKRLFDREYLDYLGEMKFPFPVARLAAAEAEQVMGFDNLPSTFYVDRKGIVRYQLTGSESHGDSPTRVS